MSGRVGTIHYRPTKTFEETVREATFHSLGKDESPYHRWVEIVERAPTTKEKGDHFEKLCEAYMRHPKGGNMADVWLLSDVPADVRTTLDLRTRDVGIDLVARDHHGGLHAIQAKFLSRTTFRPNQYRRSLRVPWRQLSTFYALAARGPYVKHWVITTGDGVARQGRATAKDKSVCNGTLKNLDRSFWVELADMRGNTLNGESQTDTPTPSVPVSQAEMRAARLARFDT